MQEVSIDISYLMQTPEPRVIHRPPCLELYSEIFLKEYKIYNPFMKPLCVKSYFYKMFGDGFSWEFSGSRLCDAFFLYLQKHVKARSFLYFLCCTMSHTKILISSNLRVYGETQKQICNKEMVK